MPSRAVELLERFYAVADKVVPIEEVQLALVEQRAGLKPKAGRTGAVARAPGETLSAEEERAERGRRSDLVSPMLKTRRSDLRGRTPHQIQYLKAVLEHDISFGIGPAGTGKTYLAVACAVDALERDAVKRIILTRPGGGSGRAPRLPARRLRPEGRSLPAPAVRRAVRPARLRPHAEAVREQVIEIAPLAFMRGRTLNHAFVILDEAQNTTVEQMKMFLTRIGFGSKAVVTGDVTQVDLHKTQRSGLVDAMHVLKDVRGIAFTQFSSADVVRHPLVGRIVDAYEKAAAIHEIGALPGPNLRATKCKKKSISSISTSSIPTPASKPITPAMIERWVRATLLGPAELAIRFVDAPKARP
jgi:phosphate starvation-inducible PhoH-like protein